MKWGEVKKGQLVKIGPSNFVGYIYKLDHKEKMVKVEWTGSWCDWNKPEKLDLIEISDFNHFIKGWQNARKDY
ncbi:MAG TPA: hypothetical protein VKN64_00585 [Halanaerobiales bacterium]|nr:hypothetical protein [Halanaerobiales bacterium]